MVRNIMRAGGLEEDLTFYKITMDLPAHGSIQPTTMFHCLYFETDGFTPTVKRLLQRIETTVFLWICIRFFYSKKNTDASSHMPKRCVFSDNTLQDSF